jgi:alpha-methylacyl-CoA racemase
MGVLDGIKVLEMARVPPAEMPGMFLADMGADVLKVETPPETTEDAATKRRAAFAYVNRNKRSLALNMKAPEAQAIFGKLAATADVIVEASATTAPTRTTRPTTATISPSPGC